MKEDLRKYARLGLVHHLLYPKCTVDPDDHVRTLTHFVKSLELEIFDCSLPLDQDKHGAVVEILRASEKPRAFATHHYPYVDHPPSSIDPQKQVTIRQLMQDQIGAAASIGAEAFIFTSGADVAESERPAGREAFGDLCRWICERLKKHDMVGLIEPCDRTFCKKYLYGPTIECVALIQSLEGEVDNLGTLMDAAHVPLMYETFEEGIKGAGKYLKRVHLGNCVMKDTNDPFYGDNHPPIGYAGGEIDVAEIAEVLGILLEVGYLSKEKRGDVLLECQPFPGQSPEETVADNLGRIEKAWSMVG